MVENIAIICSRFNSEITTKMLARAKTLCRTLGLNVFLEVSVPGVYDIPLFLEKVLKKKEINGVILLGAVKKGETDHDKIVANTTAFIASKLAVEHGKPVSLGIIGPGASIEKVEARADDYATRAVKALNEMLRELKRFS